MDEFWKELDEKRFLSRALILSDGKGNGIVYDCFGPAIDRHIEDYGFAIRDLGFSDSPKGVVVWEGNIETTKTFSPFKVVGTFREPTEEEWESINNEEGLWNKDDLMKKLDDVFGDWEN